MSYRHLVVIAPFADYAIGDVIKDPTQVARWADHNGFVVPRQPGADEDEDAQPEPSIHSGPEPTTAEERTAEVIEDATAAPKAKK